MSNRTLHIPIVVLWEYSRNPNPAALSSPHWNHLMTCEDCVSVLWLCNTSPSVEHLKNELRERGIAGE
jgi:hypothetical protein